MKYEEKLLTYLVENYRKSKKDSGDNKTNRRTQVKPEKLYRKYKANDGDFEEIARLNQAVEALIQKGFITNVAETFGTQIKCIYLVDEKIDAIEQYMSEKYGYISKDVQLQKLQLLVMGYKDASPICEQECELLSQSIENRRIPKNIDELEDILKAIVFIQNNREELYIREVSMRVYGDSKFFENETLQSVCSLLRKYAERDFSDTELMDEVLLDYHISKEPQKLCVKGNAVIIISGKEIDISGFSLGIEMMASDLAEIECIHIKSHKFMTIENRTSYLRYKDKDTVTFYLGGYANRYQRDFIKLIYRSNPGIEYMHFGDIDAGGFWIHHNLCEITGIQFELFNMSIRELQNDNYKSCIHALTANDRIRLKELKNMNAYMDVVDYMLQNDAKLEQEIVSLFLMKNS